MSLNKASPTHTGLSLHAPSPPLSLHSKACSTSRSHPLGDCPHTDQGEAMLSKGFSVRRAGVAVAGWQWLGKAFGKRWPERLSHEGRKG